MTVYQYFSRKIPKHRQIDYPSGDAGHIFDDINRQEMRPGEHIYVQYDQFNRVILVCVDNWRDFELMNYRLTHSAMSFEFILVGEQQHHEIMRDGAYHLLHADTEDFVPVVHDR